jgi:hypothetical protein
MKKKIKMPKKHKIYYFKTFTNEKSQMFKVQQLNHPLTYKFLIDNLENLLKQSLENKDKQKRIKCYFHNSVFEMVKKELKLNPTQTQVGFGLASNVTLFYLGNEEQEILDKNTESFVNNKVEKVLNDIQSKK